MTPSSQKQTAIDNLVREVGKAAVVRMVGCRYTGKWSHYQHYLLADGHTVYVNLDRDPMTATRSKEPNKRWMGLEAKREARQEKKLAKKAEAEAAKKVEPKAKRVRKSKPVVKFDKDLPTVS